MLTLCFFYAFSMLVMNLGALRVMHCLLSAEDVSMTSRGGSGSGRRHEMLTWRESSLYLSELVIRKPLWSPHKFWDLGALQGDGEEGFVAMTVLSHNLLPKGLTALLSQFKHNRDVMDFCAGDIKEHNCSFLSQFPVLVRPHGVTPAACWCTSSPSVHGQMPQHRR